jgi:peroxiredoxin
VIGVAVKCSRDAASALAKKTGAKFTILLDETGKAYAAVGTDYLPRTYLIDSTGKILWLDLEYSATTRRQLNEAIRHVLEKK